MFELSSIPHSDQSRHERKLLDYYHNAIKETDPLTDPLLTVKATFPCSRELLVTQNQSSEVLIRTD